MSGTRRFKSLAAVGLGVLLSSAMLTSCSGGGGEAGTGGGGGNTSDTLQLAINAPLGSWDPGALVDASDSVLWWHAAYDTLLTCNEKGEAGPGAAESFTLSDDATTISLKLRDGMTFEDGTPVDAKAVAASVANMQDHGNEASRVKDIKVNIIDDLDVDLVSPGPNALMLTNLCMAAGIIASPDALADQDALAAAPVSSGPYTLDASATTAGSVYTFKKRDDYWNADAYPYETIVMKSMTDATARLNALKSGQVDFADVAPTSVEQAKGNGIDIIEGASRIQTLNIADREGKIVPALADKRVRQAINMVFDRDAIAEGLLGGGSFGSGTNQMFLKESVAYLDDDQTPFDVEGAKKLMAEAGYADGFDIELPSDGVTTVTVNPMVIQQLGEIGIRAKEVAIPQANYTGDMLSGKYPIFFLAGGFTANPLYGIGTFIAPGGVWNVNKTSDPELDAMLADAQTLTGAEAEENFKNINRWVIDSGWFAPLAYVNSYYAVKSGILDTPTSMYIPTPKLSDFK